MRKDISLTDLAEYLGLSPAYVSRLFKESLGMGFVEYLNTNRINRAKILLEETQIMVDQIGFEVGFNNVRSFMRTFKQYEGISPGGYRIEHRQKTAK
jgi:YesN/AraC family two-component response regulator